MAYDTTMMTKYLTNIQYRTSNIKKMEHRNNGKRIHGTNNHKTDKNTISELLNIEEDFEMEQLFWPGNNKLRQRIKNK